MTRTIVLSAYEAPAVIYDSGHLTVNTGSLVTEGDPNEVYPAPDDVDFLDEDDPERILDFKPGRDLEPIGAALIEAHPELFRRHGDYAIRYLWKREGGSKNGTAVLGTCRKASGLVKYWADCDFIITLAADHVRMRQFSRWQLEALLFHEMLHIAYDFDTQKPVLRAHDFEGFTDELRHYGLWRGDFQAIGRVVRQLPMFGEDR